MRDEELRPRGFPQVGKESQVAEERVLEGIEGGNCKRQETKAEPSIRDLVFAVSNSIKVKLDDSIFFLKHLTKYLTDLGHLQMFKPAFTIFLRR